MRGSLKGLKIKNCFMKKVNLNNLVCIWTKILINVELSRRGKAKDSTHYLLRKKKNRKIFAHNVVLV